ncbi:hypothetical protein [Pseudochelatococcus sp. G4_1912]|uniref:hypothetical protein n=1 Tax=Pseudochelatococcus sp. G4_1912 TaxID=3114288 RepID=UPI0039C5E1B6
MTAYDPHIPLIQDTGVYYSLNDQAQPNTPQPVKDVSGQLPPLYQAVLQAGNGQHGNPLPQNTRVHPMPQGAHNFAQQYTAQQTPNAPLLGELSTSSKGRDEVVINVAPHAQMQDPAPKSVLPYFSRYGSLDPIAPPNRARIEEYKRKIELLLCRYFDKSATKAANIVKYLPTEKLELHLPAREVQWYDSSEWLPEQVIIYQPEDILKRIYEGMLWCKDDKDNKSIGLYALLHFEGWQPSDTKDERLRMRALMLLTCAWIYPTNKNDLALIILRDYVKGRYDCLLKQHFGGSYGAILNKYTKDPLERDAYNVAKQKMKADIDKEIKTCKNFLDSSIVREIINERNKIEGKPLIEEVSEESRGTDLAALFVLPRVLEIFEF